MVGALVVAQSDPS